MQLNVRRLYVELDGASLSCNEPQRTQSNTRHRFYNLSAHVLACASLAFVAYFLVFVACVLCVALGRNRALHSSDHAIDFQ